VLLVLLLAAAGPAAAQQLTPLQGRNTRVWAQGNII
jgi:hypothetical protein